ncbi:MAG: hypothetical protein ACRDF7_08360 [Candidatus Limnocylindrales bacterium]
MRRTNLSLYYLAGYLLPAGIALMFVPDIALKLLQSNGDYNLAPFRMAGLVLVALGILIVQIVRHKLEVLYPATLLARLIIAGGLAWLFASTSDPFFLVIFVVVVFGMVLTGVSFYLDRRAGA